MSNVPHSASPPPASQRSFLGCAFAISFLLNIAAGILIVLLCIGLFALRLAVPSESGEHLREKHVAGSTSETNKIAIVGIEGIIAEGFLGFAHKQIEQAARDDHVKAVVLRINSPGGSVTASEDLYRRIVRLRDGDKQTEWSAKPLVVSMSSIAASGGYYIAVPAGTLFAEKTTITGSIGVYVSFPNFVGLMQKAGVSVNTIKAGEIKDAGSPFAEMPAKEKQALQDMVDAAYVQFLEVVEKGRGQKLPRKKLLERFMVTPLRPDPQADPKPAVPYQRYRADGGIFTAAKAKELDLIDQVGTLEDAIKAAAQAAGITGYNAIRYQKPRTLTDLLLNARATPAPAGLLDVDRLRAAISPRLWYLAPGYEAAGLLAASEESR
jgi:protease-4